MIAHSIGINDIVRLKLPSPLADLILVAVAAHWLRERRVLRWAIPLFLALHPGLIINSALWSQSDSVFTCLLVIALLLMRGSRPSAAWLCYVLAIMTKFQAVAMLPLMVILTLRAYPLKRALTAPLIGVGIFAAVFYVFATVSGYEAAMKPYLGSIDIFPLTTVNAYNLWVMVEPGYWSGTLGPTGLHDAALSWFPPLTFRQVGFLLLGAYTLVITIVIWRRTREPREFVWAAALFFGFFMLPTQIHERYLYPAVIMSIFAIAQDRRMILAAVVTIWTFTLNLISGIGEPFYWFGTPLRWLIGAFPPVLALLNLLMLVDVTLIALFRIVPRPLRLSRIAVLVVTLVYIMVVPPPSQPLPQSAHPITGVIAAEGAQLIGSLTAKDERGFFLWLYWRAPQPVYGNYVGWIDAEQDGQIIATSRGSGDDAREGTWRWTRGAVHRVTYHLDTATTDTDPIFVYLTLIDASTRQPVRITVGGSPQPTDRLLIAAVHPVSLP